MKQRKLNPFTLAGTTGDSKRHLQAMTGLDLSNAATTPAVQKKRKHDAEPADKHVAGKKQALPTPSKQHAAHTQKTPPAPPQLSMTGKQQPNVTKAVDNQPTATPSGGNKVPAEKAHNTTKAAAATAKPLVTKNQPTVNKTTASASPTPSIASLHTPTDALNYLLQGSYLSLKQFYATHWEQKPLHIARNAPTYYQTLQYSKQQFDRYVEAEHERMQYGVNVNLCTFDSKSGQKIVLNPVAETAEEREDDAEADEEADNASDDENNAPQYQPVTPQTISNLYTQQRATIQHHQPQQHSLALWKLLSLLEQHFTTLVGCNAYITPPNAQGLAPHYDDIEAFVLQIEGSKRWKVYAPLSEDTVLPTTHSGDIAYELLEGQTPVLDITLQPGDLLYMPRGSIHYAVTSETASTHLTISTYQRNTWGDFLELTLSNALRTATQHDVAFRKGLPVGVAQYMGTGSILQQDIAEQCSIGDEKTISKHIEQQQKFTATYEQLLAKLGEYVDLHASADDMLADYMRHRLPPPSQQAEQQLQKLTSTTATDKQQKQTQGLLQDASTMQQHGEMPVNIQSTAVRLLNPASIRISVGELDTESEDDSEDDEQSDDEEATAEGSDGDKQYLTITFSTYNSVSDHMSSDSDADAELLPQKLRLPLESAPALLTLMNTYPEYIPMDELPSATAEGEEAAVADTQVLQQMALALWSCGLLETKEIVDEADDAEEEMKAEAEAPAKVQPPKQKNGKKLQNKHKVNGKH